MFISWFPAGPAKGGRFKKPYLNQVIIKGLESQRKIQKGKGRDAALPFAEAYFKKLLDSRLLKKVQMQGVEEREMRRTLLYAAITSDDDNDADGNFKLKTKKNEHRYMCPDCSKRSRCKASRSEK